MKRWCNRSVYYVAILAFLFGTVATTQAQRRLRGPVPGDIFREYSRAMLMYADWRVTDPNATDPRAQEYKPNQILYMTIADLQHATRAEAVIDLWGGHAGTTGKAISFNDHDWISIPELATPPPSPECYNSYANITVDVPLSNLVEGTNYFQGTNAGQTCHNFHWGQHGQFGIVLRVYYDSTKAHPTGSITSIANGGTLTENPTITATASSTAGVSAVDFVGYFDGFDTDGDGVYADIHYNWHRFKTETGMILHGQIGTATSAPYQVTWNTDLVPDQALGSVSLAAYIRDNNGMCYMTKAVENLSLLRVGKSVKLYKSYNIPEEFEVRGGGGTNDKTCNFTIPVGTQMSDANSATMLVSTFNGLDGQTPAGEPHWTKVNGWTVPEEYGYDHYCSFDYITVPTTALLEGENTFLIHSESSVTGIDINWPGPQYVVKYIGTYGSPAPPQPVLAFPPNNNASQPLSVTLKWRKAMTASSYRLQMSRDSLFTSLAVDDSTIVDTVKTVSGLSPFTKYYWHVQAKNAATTGVFSATWNFTTFVLVPSLISPANNTSGQPTSLTLKWNKIQGGTAYYVQLGIDSTFAGGLLVDDSTKTDTTQAVSGLTYNTQYYWHVAGKTGASTFSPFSATWSFHTLIPVPGQVTLVNPASDNVVTADSAIFTWKKQAGATKYWFELGYESLFVFKTIDSTLTDTLKVEHGLTNTHTYSWKVRAGNDGGWGAYSVVRHFSTVFTGVEETRALPTKFRLQNNYPNPFNPSTRIDFEIPRESRVTLMVYNMLGEVVALLVDEVKPAGYHSVTFDASGLASGVYFYRMNAGDVNLLKKMVLLK